MKSKYLSFLTAILFAFSSVATNHVVNTQGMTFSPSNITITVGDSVTFNNTGGVHNVNGTTQTFPQNPESFGNNLGSGWTYVHVFTTSGLYDYQCDPHIPGMVGTILANPSNTIYDIVSNSPDHTTLKVAVDACALDGALSGAGPLTLFAPTDAAFNLLPAGTVSALLNDIPLLTSILQHHVVQGSVMSSMLSNNQVVTTLNGTDVTVTINSSGVFIDNAQVTVADIIADNGVVHVIDAVLLPTTPSNTIYDIVSNSPDHTTLKVAVDACALDGVLSGSGPYTLFAPTDAAFNLLPAGTVAALLNDIPQLTNILKHHVVADSVMSTMLSNNQVVTTLLGTDITVTINANGVFIDNAQVIVADLVADNGVVHVIDAVLLPPAADCAGIISGTALVDSCGTCHQAILYNFITNTPTFVDNANILVPGVDYDPATEILVLANDAQNPLWISDPALCSTNTVYDIVSNSTDHTTLKTAIDACGLDGYLSASGPFTLFAPTDAAFNLLPAGTVAALLNDIPQLTDILKHHVVADSVMSTMLSNNQVVTTLLGTDITVTINANGVFIDNAQVIVADLVADNGVVHVIDAVLLPPAPSNTIYDIVSNSADHTTLKAAINACALDGTLSGPGPFTLFAPTDAAFDLLPAGTVAALLNDIPQLTDILLHHVVGDSVMSGMLTNGQVVTTLNGTVTITVNKGILVDNAMVTVADIIADNGVVHVIDAVLLPSTTSTENLISELNREFLYSVNILGKKVNKDTRDQVLFDIYSNGDVIKRLIK
ncbi:fasciclin domain-containing protein [Flavobacteriales bacterium]|nr:fasciclin domain-containing protein [Flavobacteriales bacterium]